MVREERRVQTLDYVHSNGQFYLFLASYVFLWQIIPAFYKSLTGGPEAQQELDKQLTELEKELGDKKFVGGEVPPVLKQMMQVTRLAISRHA